MNGRILIFIVILILGKIPIYSQVAEKSKINVNLSLGLEINTITDQLLNYFQYSGKTFLPVKLEYHRWKNKNLFSSSIYYHYSKLYPNYLPDTYYEYNYLKNRNIEFSFEYYRNIMQITRNIQIYIGALYNAYFLFQEQLYKNTLFDFAQGYRKSYFISPFNLTPNLMVNVKYNNNIFRLKTGYNLLNYTIRPDDNYVKQIGITDGGQGKFYSLKNNYKLMFSMVYQYNFSNKIGITSEYNFLYHCYSSPVTYKYLRKLFLIGISKSF